MQTNYKAIGQGLYDMMTDYDKAVVAFGMVPLEIMELFEKQYKKVVIEKWCAKYDMIPDDFDYDLEKEIPQEQINEASRQVTIEIYEAASRAGKMMV